jgi:hypothetical protein
MARFPNQADKTEIGFCCPSARIFADGSCFWTCPLYLWLRPQSGRVDQIGGMVLVPQYPSAILNHVVPSMVTSPLTKEEWRRNRAGMWPENHKA